MSAPASTDRVPAADRDAGSVGLSYSEDGHVATITLDRAAKLNTLTLPLLRELRQRILEVGASRARLLMLRTAGEKVFCVGADINQFSALEPAQMWREWIETGHQAFDALARLRQPSIAVVDGLAFGGGLELALACDFRVIADETRIALPETGLGTVPGWGGTERATELVGRARAKELVLTRRQLSGAEAVEWGLATAHAPKERLAEEAERIAGEILAGAPVAIQLAKQIIDAAAEGAPSRVLEALAGGLASATADLAEGVAAFRGKRTPTFTDH
ncbi:enoyl-CoA hydratase/isomerase family protein [Sinomonas sp. P10A9]|uniref:enoyl-CoA hydratase n=1 Tax=Sinomonas puerhi TaxID=3238584 RepID=A0AB39L576_9MICC